MGVSRLIRPAETTLYRHFVVSLSRRDSIASSSWQCIPHFDIIVRIRMLRKECDIVWGNRTEFTFARRRPEQTRKTTYLLYRYCQGIRHALHHCRALRNCKRRALRVHLSRPAFLPLKRVFPLHQSELSSAEKAIQRPPDIASSRTQVSRLGGEAGQTPLYLFFSDSIMIRSFGTIPRRRLEH